MDSRKQEDSRRRTIVSKKTKETSKKESKSSFTSFLFGGKTVSPTASATATSSKSSKSSKSDADSHKSSRNGLARANSGTSISSAVSGNSDLSPKNSVNGSVQGSVKGSVKGSGSVLGSVLASVNGSAKGSTKGSVNGDDTSRAPRSHKSLTAEDEEVLENKTVEISMRLHLWEGSGGSKTKHSSSKKENRSLNRDNSTGSNVSNLSNISGLTNNSSISILSRSSSGSLVSLAASQPASQAPSQASSPRNASLSTAPFNPAAAAAQSRLRFYGESGAPPGAQAQADAQREVPVAVRVSTVQPTMPSHSHTEQHHSPSHAAAEALTAPSAESTPHSSPKQTNMKAVRENKEITRTAEHASAVADADIEPTPLVSQQRLLLPPPIITNTPASAGPSSVPSPSMLPAKPALKSPRSPKPTTNPNLISNPNPNPNPSPKASPMEALPNRSADIQSARLSWVQNASNFVPPARIVQFSSSTKSMSSLSLAGNRGGGAGTVDDSNVRSSGNDVSTSGEDVLVIDGATLVEDEEEIEEVMAVQVRPAAEGIVSADEEVREEVRGVERKEGEGKEAERGGAAVPQGVVLRHVQVTETQRSAVAAHNHTLPLPSLHHVDVAPKLAVAPAPQAEFQAVKLKHTEGPGSPARLTSSASASGSVSVSSTTDQLPSSSPASTNETPRATLSDPRLPLEELVRRNARKQYDGLNQKELEVYLTDAEFAKTFRMKRESFYGLSQWRQQNQKRSVGLF